MSALPSIAVSGCPNCRREPKLKFKSIFWSKDVRLECACGIAGAWRQYDVAGNPWNTAADGWRIIASPWIKPSENHSEQKLSLFGNRQEI